MKKEQREVRRARRGAEGGVEEEGRGGVGRREEMQAVAPRKDVQKADRRKERNDEEKGAPSERGGKEIED